MQVKSIEGEHSAILSTFIKLPFVIEIFVLSILMAVLHRFYCSPTIYMHMQETFSYDCLTEN